jgi:predicted RNA-binding protein with PIN domain
MRLLVDGMNVIGSRPDGWWRDRDAAMRRLAAQLSAHAAESGDEVTVVLDARPFDLGEGAGGVDVRFAPGGRNAADDEIVRIVGADPEPAAIHVVSSDRELAARAEELGAHVIPARGFRARLDGLE